MAKQPLIVLQIDLLGPGPFQLPMVVQLASLEVPEDKDQVVAEFLSQDGKRIFAAISYPAVEQLVKARQSARLDKTAVAAPELIYLSKPVVAYELPSFSSFEGYLQRASDHRVLIFSTDHGQKVWLPLGPLTYKDLLGHLNAALIFYQRPSQRH